MLCDPAGGQMFLTKNVKNIIDISTIYDTIKSEQGRQKIKSYEIQSKR